MFNLNAICQDSLDGQSIFASSVIRPSSKSAWRFLHQSTNSLKHWTSKLLFNSSSSWKNTAQRQNCKRALVWRQRPKQRLLVKMKPQQRSQTPWELDATPSPSLSNRRKLNLSSSLMMLTQLRWVLKRYLSKYLELMKRISSPEEQCWTILKNLDAALMPCQR